MTKMHPLPQHQQVCWSATVQNSNPTAICAVAEEERIRDEVAYRNLDAATPQPGLDHDGQRMSLYPILSDRGFVVRLQRFHEVLVKAIVNIVDRWWDDTGSDFPSRMPLEPESEAILKWIDAQSKKNSMPAFADCLGIWRPDFLLTDNCNASQASETGFQLCEINCRTPFNAIVYAAYKHQIMGGLLRRPGSILEPAGDADILVDGLLSHFDLHLPIHIVRGRDGLDRRDFALLVEQKTGSRPKMQPEPRVRGVEEKPERIHQAAMVLFADEYSSLSGDILRHLAKAAVNDFRTNLLVNDQRFLGIILQELENLVRKHHVLTLDEADTLHAGIVPTILPGSLELQKLLPILHDERGAIKSGFICKAARSSRGNGHLLGSEISKQEWESVLLRMQDASIRGDATSYVLQPYVQQPKFDIVVDKDRTVCGSQMVGSYFCRSGRFAGLAPWRTSSGKICNVYGAGCLIVESVTTVQEDSLPPIQICPSASKKANRLILPAIASLRDRKHAEETYLSGLFQYTSGLAHLPYELRYMSPNPILVSRSFLAELERFHHALAKALNNIVARWFSDREAGFPMRMPLERHEEELLQWVSQQSENNDMHPYAGHQGNWRPDLLLPADGEEAFKMCEINARYPFNGIELAALFYQALGSPETKPASLNLAADPNRLFDAIFQMFNPSLPIHFLQSRRFIESRKNVMAAFFHFAEKRTGRRPRVVSPEQLRLVSESSSRTGYGLYCTTTDLTPNTQNGEKAKENEELEKIHQVGLQLTDGEYAPLPPDLRHHLALHGINEVRSMLLVQDKRILGIVHQELDALVSTHGVLSPEEANLLRRSVIPTIIPGSKELQELRHKTCHEGTVSKNEFILKPIRASRGAGIVFGDELSSAEWEGILTDLQDPAIQAHPRSDRTPYVIQPVVTQGEDELFLDEEMGTQRSHRVGAYHAVNGAFVGLGAWRVVVSSQRTCNMATGRAWKLMSMVV